MPEAALREAVLNALIHKDYSSGTPIQISVYPDKLMLWNPGELPLAWTVAKLKGKHPSQPFNPDVANAFFRAGMIEAWGRGVEFSFQAKTPEETAQKSSVESSVQSSVKTPDRILRMIRQNPGVVVAAIAAELGLTSRAVEKQVRQLKAAGHLRRIGPTKGGHWEVLK